MEKLIFTSLILFSGWFFFPRPVVAVQHNRIIFLHHSTGRCIYGYDLNPHWECFDGTVDSDCDANCNCDGLARWFCQYNQSNGENFEMKEVEWPCGHGQNDPEVYENIFTGSVCSTACDKLGSRATRDELGNVCSISDFGTFSVIMFKTCFTESGIDNATRLRYMENYQAMGVEFDSHPEKIFILWNLFPNQNGTSTSYDRDFSQWLKNTYAPQHTNVYVWDVFEYFTCGSANSLYSAYDQTDNHPNDVGAKMAVLGGTNLCGEPVIGLGDFIVQSVYDYEQGGPTVTPGQPTTTPTRTPTPTRTLTPSITPTRSPTPTTPPGCLAGDADNNGVVNKTDIFYLLQRYLQSPTVCADQVSNGKLNSFDVGNVILRLASSQPTPTTSAPTSTPTQSSGTVWRPFGNSSPWNTPLGSSPTIDPNSDNYMNKMAQDLVNYGIPACGGNTGIGLARHSWTIPVYFIDEYPASSLKTVTVNHNNCGWGGDELPLQLTVPVGTQPDPTGDGHLCIINRNSGMMWDFFDVSSYNGSWAACHARSHGNINTWSGVFDPYVGGCREAGFPLIAGLVRPEEIEAGRIEHALVWGFNAKNGDLNFISPASTGAGDDWIDGDQTYILPNGARLQLKPGVDISGFGHGAKILATAMREYGMYLGDEGCDFTVYLQNDHNGNEGWNWNQILTAKDTNDMNSLTPDSFRVIRLY